MWSHDRTPPMKRARSDDNESMDTGELRITCLLPPCHQQPRHFNLYLTYQHHMSINHDYVCDECHRKFPLMKLLEIHIDECHNPFVAIASDQGRPVYQCFECPDKFVLPKIRNQHMMDTHHYSPQFKFDIVTRGI